LNAIFIASSFTLGPIIGGWLTTHLSWHWVFYINIPIGIMAIILGFILLPPLEAKERVPVDLIGTFLLAMGLGFLNSWDNKGAGLGVVGSENPILFRDFCPLSHSFFPKGVELRVSHP